jgi:hypothetical protein
LVEALNPKSEETTLVVVVPVADVSLDAISQITHIAQYLYDSVIFYYAYALLW